MKAGGRVSWDSQAGGSWTTKTGTDIREIPAGEGAGQYVPAGIQKPHIKFDDKSINDRALAAVPAGRDGQTTHYYCPRKNVLAVKGGKNMNELQIFENSEFGSVRTVDVDGKTYFVANDVAKALGYVETAKAVRTHCKGVSEMDIPSNGGIQKMKIIPEGDIYRLVIKSQLPTAERFERWVFDEILPSIRRNGMYATDQVIDKILENLDFGIELLTKLKEERAEKERLQQELDRSRDWYSIKRVAALNGVSWKTFDWGG